MSSIRYILNLNISYHTLKLDQSDLLNLNISDVIVYSKKKNQIFIKIYFSKCYKYLAYYNEVIPYPVLAEGGGNQLKLNKSVTMHWISSIAATQTLNVM